MISKKKKRLFITIGVAAAVFAAAAALIYYFVNRNNISEHATVTLAEIVSDSRIPDKKYDNLDFSNTIINIPKTDKLYKYYYDRTNYTPQDCEEVCFELYESILHPLIKDFIKSEVLFQVNDFTDYTNGEHFYNEEEKTATLYIFDKDNMITTDDRLGSCLVGFNGSVVCYRTLDTDMGSIDGYWNTVEKLIRLDCGEEIPDETYNIGNTDYSIKQALAYANEYIETTFSKYLFNAEVVPTLVAVVRNNEETDSITGSDYHAFYIRYEFRLDGVPITDSDVITNYDCHVDVDAASMDMIIAEADCIGSIGTYLTVFPDGNDGELEDRFISLEKAADLISDFFAPNYTHEISEIAIKYASFYDWAKEYGNDEKIYIKPYWCFITYGETPTEEDVIYVDMQTGEIISLDPETHCYISSFD